MGVCMTHVGMRFPGSPIWAHISAFEPFTYKKAHRHGPGTIVILLSGEGYSLMYPEGGEPVVCPWHEGSAIVPPNAWFHHHFVLSDTPARTLALHRSRLHPGLGETVEDYERNEIQYWQESPAIRERFERELQSRGHASKMPPDCYTDPNFDSSWGRQGERAGGTPEPASNDFATRTQDYRTEREAN